jgi:peptidoglycan-N-acetylglucosamine deacetylase
VIGADVRRPNRRTVVARFRPGKAGLHPHLYHWQMMSQWSGSACPSSPHSNRKGKETRHNKAKRPPVHRDPCLDRVPGHHQARFRLRPVQPVGCKDSGPSPVFNGSGRHKRVALTFDDGPSDYTPQIQKILEHEHAKATFFEIGQEVPGRTSASRAIIEAGDELGNHSLHHENKPGSASMAATQERIRSATGFEPCLFRPPSGNFDSRVVSDARGLGMTTVIWDVDPADWATPGTGAIYSRVVSHTRPGSIVIMHDGGGNRSETVAALPHIIHTLRERGYNFVTVSKLLHQRMIVRPVS